MTRNIEIAARVIAKSNHEYPADSVLRLELKNSRGITRNDGAAISEAVFAYYRWLGWLNQKSPIYEQLEEAVQRHRDFQNEPDSISAPELQRAIPGWIKEQVDVTPEWLRALQREPNIWLRARPGKGKGLGERLGECWITGDDQLSDALKYEGTEDLFRTPEFYAGEFELQDLSSQVVGWSCNPRPGETWWDACAGEGGKMLHLSDLMGNKGMLWASDRAEWRLKKLKRRAARAKVFNYRTVLWNGEAKLPTKTKFDGILVDAPCSGIGTWQRNPQARWTLTAKDVIELGAVQQKLLANVMTALKPGGKLIYSVCTLTKSETTEVARAISDQFAGFKPLSFINPLLPNEPAVERLWLWPQTTQANGMFICGWEKVGSP